MARESMKRKRMEKAKHIIEVAAEVFSEKGFHGALTDEIADRAGISKRSMYYYIGDKDMLYEAVLKYLMERSYMYLFGEIDEKEDPEKKLRRFIRGLGHIAKMRPLHSIALRELFAGGKTLPETFRNDVNEAIGKFFSICEELQLKHGEIDAPPIVVMWMVTAFFIYWETLMPYLFEGKDCAQRQAIESIGKEVNEKLIREVEKIVFKILIPEKASGNMKNDALRYSRTYDPA